MKPRTEAQKIASRNNGAHSKGPVTPEGKAKASLNAITHGLHAVNPVLQTENPAEWETFLSGHVEEWNPLSLTEWDLVVNDLAGTKWRLKRLRTTETALMDLETERVQDSVRKACARPDSALLIAAAWESLQSTGNLALDRLHRHETRLCRIIATAKSQLEALRAARLKQELDNNQPSQQIDPPVNEPEQPQQPEQQPQQTARPVLVIRPATDPKPTTLRPDEDQRPSQPIQKDEAA